MFLYKEEKTLTAIVNKNNKISYGQLGNKINVFSNLFDSNITDKIAIFSENRIGWIYSFYAGWKNNTIVVPIDFMSTTEELAYILEDCKPEVVFTSETQRSDLEKALKRVSYKPIVIGIDQYEESVSDSSDADYPSINPDLNSTAIIIYTSGTTGNPKGVMLSYKNIMANVTGVSKDVVIYRREDVVLMLLPLHHVFPLLGTMVMPLSIGETIALSPSMTPDDIINTLKENKVTLLIGVPRLLSAIHKGIMDKINASKVAKSLFALAEKVDSQAFSKFIFKAAHDKFGGNIRYLVCGGAALDTKIANDFKTLGFKLLEGYGMTEAAPMISFTRPNAIKVGSPGFPLPACEVKIKDGEIIVRGENIMQAYYNRPEETADVIKDGWLYTGDLGYFDKKGFLYITGRRKEIIVLSNGKNINPVEIETKLEHYAAFVKEAGVYQNNDSLHAIIVPADELLYKSEDTKELYKQIKWQLIDDYNKKCTPYKKIMDFTVFEGELPRTQLGKIRRFQLHSLEVTKEIDYSTSEKINLKEYDILSHYLETEKGKKVLPYYHLEMDLGMDSLDKVSLQVFIQSTFGVDIDPGALVNFSSVKELAYYLKKNRNKMKVEKIDWTKILREKVHISLPKTWFTGRALVKISKFLFSAYFRLRGKGLTNIPDEPCIIAPNHQSFFDGLFVASFLKDNVIKNTYFYAKEKHVKGKWLKFLANRNNIIVMDLNKDLKESIQKMGEALKKNKNLIIFPEGTRTMNGSLGDFKKTFAILSRELNVPIVPVSIKGAFDALPKGNFFPKPFKKVIVEFLEPVIPEGRTYEKISQVVYNKIHIRQKARV